MSILWTIVIGFVAGVIAKLIHPGPNEPSGFILTTILGIVGAFAATYLGQTIGWYRADEGAGLYRSYSRRSPGALHLEYDCPTQRHDRLRWRRVLDRGIPRNGKQLVALYRLHVVACALTHAAGH